MYRSGFTIIELMIASALTAIVMMFTMQIFTVNNRTYTKIDSVVNTQQGLRAVVSVIERDARHAGMMIPEGAAACGVDNTADPDLFYVSDHTAVNPETAIGFFDGALVQGTVSTVSSGTTTLTLDTLVIEPGTPDPAYDTNGDGTNDSDFQVNAGVIIVDLMDLSRGSVCGVVTNVDLATPAITVDINTAGLGASGGAYALSAVPALEYRVDAVTATLYRNNLRLAAGIEDLQIAYFLDTNGNNIVDVGELRGTTATAYLAATADASDLRAVRINVVARARAEDDEFTQGYIQATENRSTVGATADGFRRRVHTATVRMRNVGDRVEGG